ncbi:MAG TPA: SBBP repeat-containing protein [Ignavibacteria bacterium]|nr:SBBP repeat-containing protein [Ignavibacteria bacterium]
MKYIILIIFLFLNSLNVFPQFTRQWVAKYNGPGNSSDEAKSITVDVFGNVYVTGESTGGGTGGDYATVKYNSVGVQQWVARYNGPGNNIDKANSIVVDDSGNVYVTGGSIGSGLDYDYATVKYNSSGVQQWVARYNGPDNIFDYAYSIAIDNLGFIYVTGESQRSQTGLEITTIKYNSSGVQQWVSRYIGSLNENANSIKVDALGNVYVAGNRGNLSHTEYISLKYNSSGVQQWVAIYSGGENTFSNYSDLAIDVLGNVYVTGSSRISNLTGFDYTTVKYNSLGVQQWVAKYNGLESGPDYANSVAVDASGNVYITGNSRGNGTNYDYATVKYNSSGIQEWINRYNGPGNNIDQANSIAVDISGNVYVSGESFGTGTNFDYATIKYNSSGVQQWIDRYNGTGNGYDYASSIIIDASNNVYVTGGSLEGETYWDFTTIKYSQSTGVSQILNEIPLSFSLEQNYPNPFNPVTKIRFSLPKSSFVKLIIYDTFGRELETIFNGQVNSGFYEADWNAVNYSSGVYFYRIEFYSENLVSGEFTDVKKMILIK